jgi:hypothetical protein
MWNANATLILHLAIKPDTAHGSGKTMNFASFNPSGHRDATPWAKINSKKFDARATAKFGLTRTRRRLNIS